MLDTHQLQVFLAAAETLNFSRAAERLHLSQPSVTQHIQLLEAHFGMPLFLRAGRRVSLTEAGARLVPLARELVLASIRTDEIMDSLKGEVHGELRIGCSTTPGKYVLPPLLAEFMRHYPRVEAEVNVTSRDRALRMLRDGRVHLALSSVFEYSSEIEFHRFITEPIVLITPLDHPWAQRSEIEPDELMDMRFILREETSGTYTVLRDGLAKIGINITTLNRVLTLGNSEAIAFAVQEGIGVGFVSRLVARRIVRNSVAQVHVKSLDLSQDVYIGRHLGHPATSAQAAFWQFVTDPNNLVLERLRSSLVNE